MSQVGFSAGSAGYVADQQHLLEAVLDGLAVYNSDPSALIDPLVVDLFSENARVPMGPLDFEREAEGTSPDLRSVPRRRLRFPLETFDTVSVWSKTGLEDALPEDILADADAAIKGDAQRVKSLFMASIFLPKQAGTQETPYHAAFYNGETDVPAYGDKAFPTAHSHYRGTGSASLSRAHLLNAVEDVAEHGYRGPYVGLFSIYQQDDVMELVDPVAGPKSNSPEAVRAWEQGLGQGVTVAGIRILFDESVPAGYFAVLDSSSRPIGRRQHLNPAYRGLRIERDAADASNPLVGAYFRRRIGFGVRMQGAGAVRAISASGTYSAPTMRLA